MLFSLIHDDLSDPKGLPLHFLICLAPVIHMLIDYLLLILFVLTSHDKTQSPSYNCFLLQNELTNCRDRYELTPLRTVAIDHGRHPHITRMSPSSNEGQKIWFDDWLENKGGKESLLNPLRSQTRLGVRNYEQFVMLASIFQNVYTDPELVSNEYLRRFKSYSQKKENTKEALKC